MSQDRPVWGCQGLGVRYGGVVALEGVTLEVPAGAGAGGGGGGGAGETPLLRALAGAVRPAAGVVLRPDERRLGYVSAGPGGWAELPVEGNLRFAGRAYGPAAGGAVLRPDERRLGYVSAGPGVWADLTVEENLSFAGRAYGLPAGELDRRTAAPLERTDLASARDRLAGRLSGGMRQKLALAMAVLHRPDLLILDEPTTGVDPVSRAGLWRVLASA